MDLINGKMFNAKTELRVRQDVFFLTIFNYPFKRSFSNILDIIESKLIGLNKDRESGGFLVQK